MSSPLYDQFFGLIRFKCGEVNHSIEGLLVFAYRYDLSGICVDGEYIKKSHVSVDFIDDGQADRLCCGADCSQEATDDE